MDTAAAAMDWHFAREFFALARFEVRPEKLHLRHVTAMRCRFEGDGLHFLGMYGVHWDKEGHA